MAARFSIAESQKNRCSLEDVISYIYVKSLFPKKGRGFFVCGCLCALLLYQHLDGLVANLDDCHRTRQTRSVQRCSACGCNDGIELYAIRAVEYNLCACFCTFHVDGVALCLYQNRNSLHFCYICSIDSNNLTEIAPWRNRLVLFNRCSRHMERSIFGVRTVKSIALRCRHILCITIDICQFCTVGKGLFIYILHTITDVNRGKTIAIIECTVFYAFYGVGDGHRGKTGAAMECIVSYACNGVGYGDRGKTRATTECALFYTCYRVGDGDRGKT